MHPMPAVHPYMLTDPGCKRGQRGLQGPRHEDFHLFWKAIVRSDLHKLRTVHRPLPHRSIGGKELH